MTEQLMVSEGYRDIYYDKANYFIETYCLLALFHMEYTANIDFTQELGDSAPNRPPIPI